jgi:hypothetical protein
MLQEKKLRINQVKTWEDPYENFFMKEEFYAYAPHYQKNIPISTEEISERLYGQSWTLNEESDAMWRIYSSKEATFMDKAVKVKVKIDSLFSLVYTEDSCMATTSIGQVNYLTAQEIEKWRNNCEEKGFAFPQASKECLFMKRDSFQHEREVRIIVSQASDQPIKEFLEFDIQDISIFEEYVLDPRLEQDDIQSSTEEIVKCGVETDRIRKSNLYEFVPIKINLGINK